MRMVVLDQPALPKPCNSLSLILNTFVNLEKLYYAGSYEMDIKGPTNQGNYDRVFYQPASEYLLMIKEVYQILMDKSNCVPGAFVESNKFCLSVHFRRVDEKDMGTLTMCSLSISVIIGPMMMPLRY